MEQAHLPTAEEIVEIFMKAKENNIPLSEAEWPVCLKGAKHENDILPKKEFELDSEQENFDHEKTETGPDGDSFNSKRRRVVQDTDPKKRNQWDDELAMGPMQIGLEEEREMMEWIKSEMLNEPLSDIEEFDMLLSLAKDYPKNHNLLFQLLTPKKKVSDVVKSVEEKPKAVYIAPKNIVKANVDTKCLAKGPINTKIIHEPMEIKQAPVVILPFLKPELIEPAESPMEIQVEEPPPEVPTIVDVKDIVPVQPMPEDEQAINEWLQQCSLTISQQLQAIIDEECGPNTNTSGGVDFEREITREQLTNHRNGQMLLNRMPPGQESAWQSSYRVRLEDFEDVIDQNMTQVRNAQEKQISSKWKQLYGTDNLRRSLKMPPLPIHLDQCLKRIRILRRPTKPKVEEFHLRIDMKFCKMFCSLQMGASINLNVAVNRLENAVYSTEIDVIQKRYTATQIAWIWANGTILIINGRGQNMLAETQRMLISKLNGQNNFKAKPENQLVHLRLISYAYYPWTINLAEFCETYVLCSHPMQTMHYVYYVDKSLPGVAARVHASGMIHVFAKSTIDADKMLQKLYLITANHRTS
ncbi:hypothetical protein KR018_004068 [Drosophila ironensis]|nr:hypothetical protein KR018_004068 [Drosophila ironensis]